MFGFWKVWRKIQEKENKKKSREKEKVNKNDKKKDLKLINYFYILFQTHSIYLILLYKN